MASYVLDRFHLTLFLLQSGKRFTSPLINISFFLPLISWKNISLMTVEKALIQKNYISDPSLESITRRESLNFSLFFPLFSRFILLSLVAIHRALISFPYFLGALTHLYPVMIVSLSVYLYVCLSVCLSVAWSAGQANIPPGVSMGLLGRVLLTISFNPRISDHIIPSSSTCSISYSNHFY